jgi:hypothetical protein
LWPEGKEGMGVVDEHACVRSSQSHVAKDLRELCFFCKIKEKMINQREQSGEKK